MKKLLLALALLPLRLLAQSDAEMDAKLNDVVGKPAAEANQRIADSLAAKQKWAERRLTVLSAEANERDKLYWAKRRKTLDSLNDAEISLLQEKNRLMLQRIKTQSKRAKSTPKR